MLLKKRVVVVQACNQLSIIPTLAAAAAAALRSMQRPSPTKANACQPMAFEFSPGTAESMPSDWGLEVAYSVSIVPNRKKSRKSSPEAKQLLRENTVKIGAKILRYCMQKRFEKAIKKGHRVFLILFLFSFFFPFF